MEIDRSLSLGQSQQLATSVFGYSAPFSDCSSQFAPSSFSTAYAPRTQLSLPLPQQTDLLAREQDSRNPRRSSSGTVRKPPTLVRQDERKVSFVDSLVDSATQMVEVVWPLSAAPPTCRPSSSGVLSLRRYIEETLRRSRTSYSTLQVALYYIVLIMPYVPKSDFTKEQLTDCPSVRALQCGRRMFLAALILASKYLQDRNYSAKAWSKMSGLKVAEINLNERTFLAAVSWKLHIPDQIFKRWTEVVLRYTPSNFPAPCIMGSTQVADERRSWKTVIPLLTPELDSVPMPDAPLRPAMQPIFEKTPYSDLPSFLEPQPEVMPHTPAFAPAVAYLPTPRSTPSPSNVITPAVSVASLESLDAALCNADSRRPSLTSTRSSSGSSPASMVSDSTRSSRSSSISSISTSITVSRGSECLAKTVTCRRAGRYGMLQTMPCKLTNGMPQEPIVILSDQDIVSSPPSLSSDDWTAAFRADYAKPNVASRAGNGMTTQQSGDLNDNESPLQRLVRTDLLARGSERGVQIIVDDEFCATPGCDMDEVRRLTTSSASSTAASSPSLLAGSHKRAHESVSSSRGEARKQRRLSRGVQTVEVY